MKKNATILLIMAILLPLICTPFLNIVVTQDCFVQIVSVSLNQTSLQIGEKLEVNLVYDLYFDPLDPLGIGSVSVTIGIQGVSIPLLQSEFTDVGIAINKVVILDISPITWAPNETGQVGRVQVEGWVQDSVGSMTDNVEQQFSVQQSNLICTMASIPSQISFHNVFNLTGSLQNPNNTSLPIPNHPLQISVLQNDQLIHSWNQTTIHPSNFSQTINTTLIGTGPFNCNVTASESDDYIPTGTLLSFTILKADITLSVTTNATVVQAYYPSTNNHSLFVSVHLNCQSANHSFEEANVTCSLGNVDTPMDYSDLNHFSTVIEAPSNPGNYSMTITALTPNHNTINTSVPIRVVSRDPLVYLESNRSTAAYDDIIELTVNVLDENSQEPVANKTCSIYLFNQSVWNLLTQLILDQEGTAKISWLAQNVGDQDFRFKAVFHGEPEFITKETELTITNTREFRIILNSTIDIIRQTNIFYPIQITDKNHQPLTNVNFTLIEQATNSSWSTAVSNTSGYATLTWYLASDYALGPHEFSLLIQNGSITFGVIEVIMIVFEQTKLDLV